MGRGERRKFKCRKLFRPDPRNRRHQYCCWAPACRAASKAASQARWLAQPENRNYFRGPVHVVRVQAWRGRHDHFGSVLCNRFGLRCQPAKLRRQTRDNVSTASPIRLPSQGGSNAGAKRDQQTGQGARNSFAE